MSSLIDEKLYLESSHYFVDLVAQIESAKESIDAEVYIYQDDELGRLICNKLCEAAQRGVKVRLLVDGLGSAGIMGKLPHELNQSGVILRYYHPIFKSLIRGFFRAFNRRNHRKTWLIDGRIAFLSSANVVKNDWKEIGVSYAGPDLINLSVAYNRAWQSFRSWSKKTTTPAAFLRLNHTLKLRLLNQKSFLGEIEKAKQRVWLASPYFAPRYRLVEKLCDAARRGTDVRILIPQRSDIIFMPWIASAYYHDLLLAGVKIFEYLPRFFHAKTCVIDDWMIVGSSNLNHRSILHDLEADIVLSKPSNQLELQKSMEHDFEQCQAITLDHVKRYSPLRRFIAWLLLLFKYWL